MAVRSRSLASQNALSSSPERVRLTSVKEGIREDPTVGTRVRLKVEGMTCSACSSAVEAALLGVPGVTRAAVSAATGDAAVEHLPSAVVRLETLLEAIDDAGFVASHVHDMELSRSVVKLYVDGMTCSACTGAVENALRGVSGVEEVTVVLLPKGSAEVAFDPNVTGPRKLIQAIEDAGFDSLVSSSERVGAGAPQKATDAEASRFRSLFWTSLAYTAPVFAINMILPGSPGFAWLYRDAMNHVSLASFTKWALATPVQFHVGRRFHVGAYKSLMNGSANMDVLVSMATNVAYFTSIYLITHCIVTGHSYGKDFFETSTMLVTFILLGKYLESIAKGQTSEAIGKLLDLTPNTAVLLERKPNTKDASEDTVVDCSDYTERCISSTLIHRGDLLKVYPGSRIAADGALVEGDNVFVDESMITGESLPVAKMRGADLAPRKRQRGRGSGLDSNGGVHALLGCSSGHSGTRRVLLRREA